MKKKLLTSIFSLMILLPVLTHADVSTSTVTIEGEEATSTIVIATSSEDLFITCSQNAIEKRDTSLSEAKDVYNATMDKALLSRKDSEKKIVTILNTNDKKVAIKNAVDIYKASTKKAQDALKGVRKDIWSTFEDESNLCEDLKPKDTISSWLESLIAPLFSGSKTATTTEVK